MINADMPELSQILISLIATLIFIPINALILWALTKLFKLSNRKFLTALKTAAVAAAILFVAQQILGLISNAAITETAGAGLILGIGMLLFIITIIITIVVNSYAVKEFYKEKIGKAFLVGAVWSVATGIIGLIIGAILVGIAVALVLGGRQPPLY